jgi:hypothetical protein
VVGGNARGLLTVVRFLQSTIECQVDVTTTDGYKLRMFCLAFTKKRQNQLKKTTYAQSAQIKAIRARKTQIMTKEASNCDLKDLVKKFIPRTSSSARSRPSRLPSSTSPSSWRSTAPARSPPPPSPDRTRVPSLIAPTICKRLHTNIHCH